MNYVAESAVAAKVSPSGKQFVEIFAVRKL